ncbi:hypothetical protein RhoFasB10_00892 [Rhodococcus sp. B10]|nr:hypothetical protein [Rhodococcus sp. B10]
MWIRGAWIALAIVHIGLGASVAQWTPMQITDCELGLTMSAHICNQTLWDHFGMSLVPVLAAPVVLCFVAAIACRPRVSWWVVGVMALLVVFGFGTLVTASAPSSMSLLGSVPGTVLALLLAFSHGRLAALRRHRSPTSECRGSGTSR